MSNTYTFLFVPCDGVGHFNACIGVASLLRDRGHTVAFAAPMGWKGKLEPQGFAEELYQVSDEATAWKDAGAIWGEMIAQVAPVFSLPPIEVQKQYYFPMFQKVLEQLKYFNPRLAQIMENLKPDVVILDHFFHIPAIMDQG